MDLDLIPTLEDTHQWSKVTLEITGEEVVAAEEEGTEVLEEEGLEEGEGEDFLNRTTEDLATTEVTRTIGTTTAIGAETTGETTGGRGTTTGATTGG